MEMDAEKEKDGIFMWMLPGLERMLKFPETTLAQIISRTLGELVTPTFIDGAIKVLVKRSLGNPEASRDRRPDLP